MKVCIAGGGRVGRYLAQNLLANRHKVVIIEPVEAQCRMLADTLDISVICGNSISTDTLRTADVASCDALDTVVCGTDNLSHILEREIETDNIRQLLSLGGGTASLNEILLPADFQFAGKQVMEIPIPGDTILVSITRDTEFIIPHGNTVLLPWDRILCLTQDDSLHLLTEAWGLTDK